MARKKKKNENSPTKGDPLGGYVEVGHSHLSECMGLLRTVLVRRATRKDLSTVHIEVKPGGTATIAATDMENALQLKLNVLHATGVGKVMIDAHALDTMLGAYHEPKVRIHLDDVKEIRVEGLQSKLKLPGCDPEKELKLTAPGSMTNSGWIVRADALVSAIRRVKFACDDSGGTRYTLGGIALYFPKEGCEFMEVVATDGRRISIVRLPVRAHGKDPARTWKAVKKGDQPGEGLPVVVNKAVNTLLRIALAAGNTSVGLCVIQGDPIDLEKKTFKPGRVQAVTSLAVLTTQMPEGRYPNWREVFPSEQVVASFTLPDARRLGLLLATAEAACDSEHKGVEFTMAGGCIMIDSESDTKGKSLVSLTEVEMTGRGTVSLGGLMFRQFFDAIGSSPVEVKFYGPKAPMVCHAGPDHDFVLMPLTKDSYSPPKPAPAAKKPDEPEGGGSAPVEPARPEPPVPVGATPDAHEGNGQAK